MHEKHEASREKTCVIACILLFKEYFLEAVIRLGMEGGKVGRERWSKTGRISGICRHQREKASP